MRCGTIPDGDKLFRHSVRPNGFRKDRFSARGILKWFDENDGSILGSLTWQRFFPTTEHIHRYGCRLAAKSNQRLISEGKFSEKRRRVYCGAYQFTAQSIRNLPKVSGLGEIASAEVIHHPEDGEIAHVDLRIKFKSTPTDIEGTKTAIIDRLWAASYGPLKHVCSYDTDIERHQHPSLTLIDAPAGNYVDDRSPYLRSWRTVRLKLCELIYWIARWRSSSAARRYLTCS